MGDDIMHEILRSLGRIEGDIKSIRAEMGHMREDIEEGKESRGRIHAKMERIEETVSIVGQVAAQARDSAEAVTKVVKEDVKPSTDQYKLAVQRGKATLWAVGILAGLFGVTVTTASEAIINYIRAWLRIH